MCFFKTALKKYVNSAMQHEIIPLVTIMHSQNKKNKKIKYIKNNNNKNNG